MREAGAEFEVKKLGKQGFNQELIKKAEEEAGGMVSARNRKELIEEIGDVLDVIDEIKRLKKIKKSELDKARREAAKKKGGFKKKLFLVWSGDNGYRTNEKRRK